MDENGNDANVLVPEPGTEGSLSSTRAIVVDGIRPTVITVTSPTPDGSYGIGDTIVIETLFSEPVFVDGVPEIQLASGENMGFATYVSGTGTDVLSFEYTISEGDTSSDLVYNDTTSFMLVGNSSLLDSVDNQAIVHLPESGSIKCA